MKLKLLFLVVIAVVICQVYAEAPSELDKNYLVRVIEKENTKIENGKEDSEETRSMPVEKVSIHDNSSMDLPGLKIEAQWGATTPETLLDNHKIDESTKLDELLSENVKEQPPGMKTQTPLVNSTPKPLLNERRLNDSFEIMKLSTEEVKKESPGGTIPPQSSDTTPDTVENINDSTPDTLLKEGILDVAIEVKEPSAGKARKESSVETVQPQSIDTKVDTSLNQKKIDDSTKLEELLSENVKEQTQKVKTQTLPDDSLENPLKGRIDDFITLEEPTTSTVKEQTYEDGSSSETLLKGRIDNSTTLEELTTTSVKEQTLWDNSFSETLLKGRIDDFTNLDEPTTKTEKKQTPWDDSFSEILLKGRIKDSTGLEELTMKTVKNSTPRVETEAPLVDSTPDPLLKARIDDTTGHEKPTTKSDKKKLPRVKLHLVDSTPYTGLNEDNLDFSTETPSLWIASTLDTFLNEQTTESTMYSGNSFIKKLRSRRSATSDTVLNKKNIKISTKADDLKVKNGTKPIRKIKIGSFLKPILKTFPKLDLNTSTDTTEEVLMRNTEELSKRFGFLKREVVAKNDIKLKGLKKSIDVNYTDNSSGGATKEDMAQARANYPIGQKRQKVYINNFIKFKDEDGESVSSSNEERRVYVHNVKRVKGYKDEEDDETKEAVSESNTKNAKLWKLEFNEQGNNGSNEIIDFSKVEVKNEDCSVFKPDCWLMKFLGDTGVVNFFVTNFAGTALLFLPVFGIMFITTIFQGVLNIIAFIVSPFTWPLEIILTIFYYLKIPVMWVYWMVIYIFKLPSKISSIVMYFPLVLSNFLFDIAYKIVTSPLSIGSWIVWAIWQAGWIITYIPRLPLTLLFRLPFFNLVPLCWRMFEFFFFTFWCSTTSIFRVSFRFLVSVPARIILLPVIIVKMILQIAFKIILAPIILGVFVIKLLLMPLKYIMLFIYWIRSLFTNVSPLVSLLYYIFALPFVTVWKVVTVIWYIVTYPFRLFGLVF